MLYSEFARRIKLKYPEYEDIDDMDLTNRIIGKYPEYKNEVEFDEASDAPLNLMGDLTPGAVDYRQPSYEPSQIERAIETGEDVTKFIKPAIKAVGEEVKQTATLGYRFADAMANTLVNPVMSWDDKKILWDRVRDTKFETPILNTMAGTAILVYGTAQAAMNATGLAKLNISKAKDYWRMLTIKERGLANLDPVKQFDAYKRLSPELQPEAVKNNVRLRNIVTEFDPKFEGERYVTRGPLPPIIKKQYQPTQKPVIVPDIKPTRQPETPILAPKTKITTPKPFKQIKPIKVTPETKDRDLEDYWGWRAGESAKLAGERGDIVFRTKTEQTAQTRKEARLSPMAGGIKHDPNFVESLEAKGKTPTGDIEPTVRMTSDIVVKDIATQEKITLKKGHEFRTVELEKDGKPIHQFLMQDGKQVVVDKSTLERVKRENLELTGKPWGEPEGVKEVVKGDVERTLLTRQEAEKISERGEIVYLEGGGAIRPDRIELVNLDQKLFREKKGQTKFSKWQVPGGKNYREILLQKGDTKPLSEMTAEEKFNAKSKGMFVSPHWEEPNVIAHARVNDRITPEGEKVLFIEEIQSDWARELRKGKAPENKDVENWQELTLRRVLREAVDKGYDRISWTTGQQQADRYDLSKQVKKITWAKKEDGRYYVAAHPIDRIEPISKMLKPEEIDNFVGKGIADKIRGQQYGTIEGVDLKVGGEWAKNLYDRQIPNILKDLTKKWGGKIEDITIMGKQLEAGGYGAYHQQSLKITPQIKEMVQYGGVPMAGGMRHDKPPTVPPVTADNLHPDSSDAADSYETQKDLWIGKSDLRVHRTKVEKNRLQESMKSALNQKKYTDLVKDHDRAVQIYIDLQRNPSHIDKYYNDLTDEQKRIVQLSQRLPEEVIDVANEIQSSYQRIGAEAMDENVIRNVLDNYAARIWDIESKSAAEKFRKFGTTTRHAKQRKFGTIIEGWANGFNLKVEGATNNLQILKEEIVKTIEDKRFIRALKKLRNIDGNPLLTNKQLEGYTVVEHPNFKQWRHVGTAKEAEVYGKNFFVDKEGNLFEKQNLYAPEEIASNMNSMLGISNLKKGWIKLPVEKLTKYNAVFKAWILQTSLFHHLAFMRSYWFGTNNKTWADMGIRDAYKNGLKAIKEESPLIELGVKNGLTLGLKQDWEESLVREKTLIGKIIDKIPGAGPVKDKIMELRQRQADFLFGDFGAGLKAKAFMIEYKHMQKKHPNMNPDKVAKSVANLINDDFGGLHLKRMGRDPTIQHVFRLFALAPDWTESNVRTMFKAFKAGGKAEEQLYRRFWTGIIMKGVGLTVLANYLMSGLDEDDAKTKGQYERFLRNYRRAWEEGRLRWTGVDITPIYRFFGGKTKERKYFSILGHFTDPLKFILHPFRSAHHKGSVIYSMIYEALSGKDWAGRSFTSFEDLVKEGKTVKYKFGGRIGLDYDRIPSYLLSQAKGVQPVQIQNLISWLSGEMEGFDATANSLGLSVRTTYGRRRKKKKYKKKY